MKGNRRYVVIPFIASCRRKLSHEDEDVNVLVPLPPPLAAESHWLNERPRGGVEEMGPAGRVVRNLWTHA